MASNWISDITWDERGRPYRTYLMDGPGYRAGQRTYVPPAEARAPSADDRLKAWGATAQRPGQSLFKESGIWNARTGQWERPFNWTNTLAMGAGALIAGPAVAGALAGGGGPAVAAPAGTVGGVSIAPPSVALGGSVAIPSASATAGGVAGTAGATAAQIAAQKAAEEAAKKAGGGMAGGLYGTGLTYADLISGGANVFDKLYSAHAASAANATNDAALREALAFTKQQYADQTAREQARFDATEARRVPYRQASQDTLAEFRKLLGI